MHLTQRGKRVRAQEIVGFIVLLVSREDLVTGDWWSSWPPSDQVKNLLTRGKALAHLSSEHEES